MTATNFPTAVPAAHPRTRWVVLLSLFLIRVAMGFQFQSIASVAPNLEANFGISNAMLGTLVGLYLLPGIVLAIPGGLLAKRFGDKTMLLAGTGLMTLGGLLGGVADSLILVTLGRGLAGMGVVLLFIVMPKAVGEWFPGPKLPFAIAIYLNGWPVGIGIALLTQPALAIAASWHWVSYAAALGCAAAVVTALLLFRSAPRDPPDDAGAHVPGAALSKLTLWEIALMTVGGILWSFSNASHAIVLSFGPSYVQSHGHAPLAAGAIVSINLWVGIISVPLGGWIASKIGRPNLMIVASSALAGLAILMMVADPGHFELWFAAMGAFIFLCAGVIVALPLEVLSVRNRATGLGVFYTLWYSGMGGLPAIAGWIKDITGDDPAAPILFAATLVTSIVAMLALFRWMQSARARGEKTR